ncbi:UNKNOWN [Stylonychia lemnae]|uniref:Uncharacterized protein n=1 Tax=Stylonychia lemnae TaxID=5949 RepID=A0A078AG32_STYLE|nr:UNKNOWN [Stylonychia lemnae]|eukprot:CDW80412.1 UNKNOWN [Stylonychia lemnae]
MTKGMSQQVSQYINTKLLSLDNDTKQQLRMIIQSKRQFFQKQEASELIENEQSRRKSQTKDRSSSAKSKIAKIQHQIFTREINESEMFHNINRKKSNIIEELEKAYNNQTFGEDNIVLMKQIQDDQASVAKTQDTNREQLLASQLDYSNFNEDQMAINEERPQSQNYIKQQRSVILDSSDYEIEPESRRVSKQKSNSQLKLSKKNMLAKSVTQIQTPNDKSLKSSMITSMGGGPAVAQSTLTKNYKASSNQNRQQPKINYKSNQHYSSINPNGSLKQSKFIDDKSKVKLNETLKETVRGELFEIVNNYETLALVPEDEKLEDDILELDRITKKSKGQIPKKQQVKLQQYTNNIENHKLTYSSQVQSRSPSLSQKLNQTIKTSREQSGIKQVNTNVNSKILKHIIVNTESKVRRVLRSNFNSKHGSLERGLALSPCHNIDNETINLEESSYQRSMDQLKDDMTSTLQQVNARNIAQFLKSKTLYHQQSDYELSYIFALIVATVDENIPLNNDKSDLLKRSIDDICKYLSNHGRVIYSLQKFRVLFERRESILKQIQKFQLFKKFDERKEVIFEITDSSNPIFRFTTDTIEIFRDLNKLNNQQKRQNNQENFKQTIQAKSIVQSESLSNFLSPQNNANKCLFDSTQKRFNFITPYSSISQRQSPSKQSSQNNSPTKKDKTPSVQQQLLVQKQIAIQKSYKVQLDQSVNIQQKTQQAKEREYEIARLKMQQKYLLFQLDKQERLKEEKRQKELELDYLREQGEFNSRLKEVKVIKEEKEKIRERSIENKEYRRALRIKEQEEQIRLAQENSMKALQEYQFKQQLHRQQKEKQAEEFRKKKQEILINKAHQSEQFLNSKENELDEKLKSQFDEATYRFKKLDETENAIKKELQTLKKIIKPKKNTIEI